MKQDHVKYVNMTQTISYYLRAHLKEFSRGLKKTDRPTRDRLLKNHSINERMVTAQHTLMSVAEKRKESVATGTFI